MSVISPSVVPGISRHMMKGVLSVMRPSKIEVRRSPGVRSEVGAYCKEKVIIKCWSSSGPIIGKLEIAKKLYEGLDAAGIQHVTFDRIQPEPLFSGCRAVSEVAKQNRVDAIIAFGGGSSSTCLPYGTP